LSARLSTRPSPGWPPGSQARQPVDESETGIKGLDESPLVVFFPTQKETFLGFLIHGPYRTTPARDNIPQHDAWNQALVSETAELLHDVLLELRDDDLLTVDVLQAMPIASPHFQPDTMFRPLFDVVWRAFDEEAVIPLGLGGFGEAAKVKLARGGGLRDLLSAAQLSQLYSAGEPVSWVSEAISENRTLALLRYLRDEHGIDEVTPDAIVARLTGEFLGSQSDEWISRLYAFLYPIPALWRAPRWSGEPQTPARAKPIIRLDDGSHVTPFDPTGAPRAYLPGPTETEFPTVRRAVAEVPAARQFLEALKYTEPDVVAEVIEKVMPRYIKAEASQVDREQHSADLQRIVRALAEAGGERRDRLRDRLRETPFLVGHNALTGKEQLRTPRELYWRDHDLAAYFDDNPHIWFADEGYRKWCEILTELGVRGKVAVTARRQNPLGYVITVKAHGWHERGVDGFDPDAKIDGLDHALRHPNNWRSEYVWNTLLRPNRHLLTGVIEKCSRQDFSGSVHRQSVRSPIGMLAVKAAWLPGPAGTFHRSSELALDDLPESYRRDDVLAKALDMATPVIEEASRQLGVPPKVLQALSRNPDLVARIEQELMARAATSSARTADGADEEFECGPSPDETVDFATALSEAFDRAGKGAHASAAVTSAEDVRNPDFRRERIRAALTDDKAAEPPVEERFRRVPRRFWESKDSAVRHFLLEQYGGRCQICNDSFAKRDGSPYFEGLYLVSRTRGRWVDRQGNIVCLCATCCAKFQHGSVQAADIVEQILTWRTRREGGSQPGLALILCGSSAQLRFTEKHLLDLQEIVRAELEDRS
jgi:hypothetical protein